MKAKSIALFLVSFILFVGVCRFASRYGSLSFTVPIPHKPTYEGDLSRYPEQLYVSGNQIVAADGKPVILRGLMPADPAVLARKSRFERSFFDEIAATGANVIRIPIHPEYWERDPDYLWRYLDPIVTWNGENGIYTIIDLHFIGNIETSSGAQMPDINIHSKDFTIAFWQQAASYFKDAPHVIFEIYNEPSGISPAAWRASAADIVTVIRESGANQLIIVGGVEYSKNLSWVLKDPMLGENIAFATHIYPAHGKLSWDRWFGDVSEKYPVLMTEWGWMDQDTTGKQPYLVGSQETYGQPLIDYLGERGIGWVACWYDDEWLPTMFDNDFSESNSFGNFVLAILQQRSK